MYGDEDREVTGSRAERRSAGTETVLDVLLRIAGFTQSIGGTVMVSVGKGKQVARSRQGYLRLAA